MKYSQQLALLTPLELASHKRARAIAIIWGWIHLWTFPLFSWSTFTAIFNVVSYFAGVSSAGSASQGVLVYWFGSSIPLIILAIVAGKKRKEYSELAASIRIGSQPA